jgi:hypothetical protein
MALTETMSIWGSRSPLLPIAYLGPGGCLRGSPIVAVAQHRSADLSFTCAVAVVGGGSVSEPSSAASRVCLDFSLEPSRVDPLASSFEASCRCNAQLNARILR